MTVNLAKAVLLLHRAQKLETIQFARADIRVLEQLEEQRQIILEICELLANDH